MVPPSSLPSESVRQVAATLLELGSATLGESGAARMRARIRPAWPGAAVAAPAYPVSCAPGDNLAIHVATAHAPRGAVLVVDVGDIHEIGYWGEVLTTAAEVRDLAGLVIDGGVRDVAALEAHRFPVFSTMIALPGATKNRRGTAGAPAQVGGVTVRTGDWVVGDDDGVVVLPDDQVDQILAAGRARMERESTFFEQLREGATTLELLSLDSSIVTEA